MLLKGEQLDESWPLKLTGSNHLSHCFLLFYRRLDNNSLDCSSCNLEAFKVFLNNQTHLGNAEAKCDGTNTYVVNHDFQNCKGKYCERSRTKYNWTVEKLTEMTDCREYEYI